MPTGGHDVRKRQQARDEVLRRPLGRGHQGAVGRLDADQFGLAAVVAGASLTRGLDSGAAVGARVVGGQETADHELAGLDGGDGVADLLHDAAVLVTDRPWSCDLVQAAEGHRSDPQTQVAMVVTMASVGSMIVGSGRSS